ncbi:MAG: PAS domain S-box protein [Magnetococcales bacterium]|nr:PAS domain S-box protein [Magnetococcales bacterium]
MGKNLSFKTKIFLFCLLILAAFAVSAVQAIVSYQANQSAWQQDHVMRDLSAKISHINDNFDHARFSMEHFLRTNDTDAGAQAVAFLELVPAELQHLAQSGLFNQNQALLHVQEQVQAQLQRFQHIRATYRDLGLVEGSGVYGRIREQIHQVEALLAGQHRFELLASMLELRRHEKDFISRKKDEYLEKFAAEEVHFQMLLQHMNGTVAERQTLETLFAHYAQGFHAIANALPGMANSVAESQSGFLQSEAALDELQVALDALYSAHDAHQRGLLFDQFLRSQAVFFVALLLIGFLLTWSQYDVLVSINDLCVVAKRVADGEACAIVLNRRDEIGKLANSLRIMRDSLMERHWELLNKMVALEESEKKYAAVIQLAGDPILSLDESLRVCAWNRGAEYCFGYAEAAITGHRMTELVAGSHHQELAQAISAIQADGKFRLLGVEGDFYCQRADGQSFPATLSLSTWEMDAKRYFTLIVRDNSERMHRLQQIERAMELRSAISEILQQSLQPLTLQEMLHRALDIVLAIPWMKVKQRGAIFLYNDATERLELVVHKSLAPELVALCQSIPLGYCLCGRAAVSGEVVLSDQVDARHEVNFPGMTPHGHYCVPILFKQNCLGVLNVYLPAGHAFQEEEIDFLKNIANTLAGLISRHRAEQKVIQLSRALEQSPVAILITNVQGNVEYTNPRFTSLTGYQQEEVVGQDALLLKFRDNPYAQQIFRKVIGRGWEWSGELHSHKKSGELFWEFVSFSPVLDMEQQITHYILISEDITEKMALKAAQDHLLATLDAKVVERTQELNQKVEELETTRYELIAREKMASLGRLVAGFAHELNTPVGIGVSTISGIPASVAHLEKMLEQEEVDEADLNRCLAHIRDSAVLGLANMRRAADLVTRFKRTSVDQSSESVRRFEVKETLNDVVISLHNTFKTSRIAIELEGPDSLVVCSKPGLLGQIFTNLLMNSFKHGFDHGQREGTIHIRYTLEKTQPDQLHFWYRDNGRGIEAAHVKKLFEPFFTTARDAGGSGLGTFIVYNIITDQLRGKIEVSSVPGEGVLFDFCFPVQEAERSV